MKRKTRCWYDPLVVGLLFAVLALAGCMNDGSDGTDGVDGTNGIDGVDATKAIEPEQCEICHSNDGFDRHMADYAEYNDASTLAMSITNVGVVDTGEGGPYDVTITVNITKDTVPFNNDGLIDLKQHSFYMTTYDSGSDTPFLNSESFSFGSLDSSDRANGNYQLTATGVAYDPTDPVGSGHTGAQIYGYIAMNELDTEIKDINTHVHLYSDVASAAVAYGDVGDYESAANVSACEGCHGAPYRKHGYREAQVAGLPDFVSCKNCHYDNRGGHVETWQYMVDDPRGWVDGDPATADYSYTANIMNDVHMSHSMEFPYPQSMATCNNCHEGKLGDVLADENFRLPVCKSCHAMTGPDATDDVAQDFVAHRAPAFKAIWEENGLEATHANVNDSTDCTLCHSDAAGIARPLNELHTGYNPVIYAEDGTKYNESFTTTIDSITAAGNVLTISFHASEDAEMPTPLSVSDIVPTVYVALYGYDTKDFIVSNHTRDADGNRMEYTVGSDNPNFTTVSNPGDGTWVVTADITGELAMAPADSVRRLEVAIAPSLQDADGNTVALNAPSSTFDLTTSLIDNEFYHANEIVKVDGCNACHDALATTFHSPIRGGNITVCRMCHVPTSGGSHLEMQSRSIDSYVHAIHKFQAFDIDKIDFNEPLEAAEYEEHIAHVFPNFTIKNCYACHNEGTNEVPDQSKSMPGIISGSESHATLAANGFDRDIGDVPAVVTGPAARACGGCHRAKMITDDDAGKLASFYQHTSLFGYLEEDGDGVLDEVIATIMAFFN